MKFEQHLDEIILYPTVYSEMFKYGYTEQERRFESCTIYQHKDCDEEKLSMYTVYSHEHGCDFWQIESNGFTYVLMENYFELYEIRNWSDESTDGLKIKYNSDEENIFQYSTFRDINNLTPEITRKFGEIYNLYHTIL